MGGEDQSRSVRIEVELDNGVATDAPDVLSPSGPPRWPIIAGLVLVVVLAGAFLTLRPTGDQAADGTQRIAPAPTTVPPPTTTPATTTTTVPVEEPLEVASALAAVEELGAETAPLRIEGARFLSQIVSTEGGFIALPRALPSETPLLLGSVDGLTWVEIETTRQRPDDAPELVEWFQLLPAPSGLALVGSQSTNTAVLEVATSESGAVWRTVEELGPINDGDRRVVPFAALDDSFLSLEISDKVALQDVLRLDDLTTVIEVLPASLCSAFGAGPDEGFTLSDCAEFSITGQEPPAAEPDDSGQLPGPDELSGGPGLDNGGVSFAECFTVATATTTSGFEVLESPSTGSAGEDVESFAFAGNGSFPVVTSLANGRAAVIDTGTVGLDATCDAAGGALRREPGVVVLDFVDGRAFSYEAPLELRPVLTDRTLESPIDILGEFAVTGSRSHLFVNVDSSLWSIDTGTGQWTELFDATEDDVRAPRSLFALSDSGTRLYRVAFSQLEYVDLSANSDGSLSFAGSVSTIVTDDIQRVTRFEGGVIRHATDEIIFYSDGSQIWRLPVPQ